MRYLLDTNTCIGWLRGNQPNIVARIQQRSSSDIVLCSVVVGELIYGSERASPAHQANNRLRVAQLRAHFVSYSFDDPAAEWYGKVRAQLAGSGMLIGPNDLMIAAIALTHQLTVVTHNIAEFGRVPGLSFEDWET